MLDKRFPVKTFWEMAREKEITAFNYMGALADDAAQAAAPGPTTATTRCGSRSARRARSRSGRTFETALRRAAGRGVRHDRGADGLREPPRQPQDRLRRARVDDLRGADRRRERRAGAAEHAGRDRAPPEDSRARSSAATTRREADTVEAWRNLWFHTGDRGHDGRGRVPLLPRPDEGLHPAARREHLDLGGRVDGQHARRRCSSRPPTASPPSCRSRR